VREKTGATVLVCERGSRGPVSNVRGAGVESRDSRTFRWYRSVLSLSLPGPHGARGTDCVTNDPIAAQPSCVQQPRQV